MSVRRKTGHKVGQRIWKATQDHAFIQESLTFRKLCWTCRLAIFLTLLVSNIVSGASARPPEDNTPASAGFVIELNATEADVLQVVKLVAEDTIIRGTYGSRSNMKAIRLELYGGGEVSVREAPPAPEESS